MAGEHEREDTQLPAWVQETLQAEREAALEKESASTRKALYWVVGIIVAAMFVWLLTYDSGPTDDEIAYQEYLDQKYYEDYKGAGTDYNQDRR